MRRFIFRWVPIAIWTACIPMAWSEGGVWLECVPGAAVYIDGEYAGTTEADQYGLQVDGLVEGRHTVKVVKRNMSPQGFLFEVATSETVHLVIDGFVGETDALAAMEATAEASETGMVVFQSDPPHCTIQFMDEVVQKEEGSVVFDTVYAGDHPATATLGGKTLTAVVTVQDGSAKTITFSFEHDKVETQTRDTYVLVAGTLPGSQGESLGLQRGDEIISYDGEPVRTANDVFSAVYVHRDEAAKLELVIERKKERQVYKVRPGLLGIRILTAQRK